MKRAALGFRVHTGWAAIVAVTGTPKAPEVLLRRRLELLAESSGISRFVYHAASEMDFDQANAMVRQARAATRKAAVQAVKAAVADVRSAGLEVDTAAVPGSSAKVPGDLKAILASHSYIHAAEGELFRQALLAACESCGLRVSMPRERDIWRDAAAGLRVAAEELQRQIEGLKKTVGAPWTQDQKIATAAALLALAEDRHEGAERAKSVAR